MPASLRAWWRNCALEAAAETLDIDKMEDEIAPLPPNVVKIRKLISSLELCHHKADRWVYNIIAAIGEGDTTKGLGTRSTGQRHPAERVWQDACDALSAWCAGSASASVDVCVGPIAASRLLASLGKRTRLKQWQVQRVIERIRSLIRWPESCDDPSTQYVWILLGGGAYEAAYRTECPKEYREHEDLWLATVRTVLHDAENGDAAELSLGLAIDMLWPCHWGFVENLGIVLEAIGGRLDPKTPFAACGRNITLLPIRGQMETVVNTLMAFCGTAQCGKDIDRQMRALLGEPSGEKRWLAASLDKTIRLQLDPPPKLRALSALAVPAWIRQ